MGSVKKDQSGCFEREACILKGPGKAGTRMTITCTLLHPTAEAMEE